MLSRTLKYAKSRPKIPKNRLLSHLPRNLAKYDTQQIRLSSQNASDKFLPLSGVRVLDLSRVLAGPLTGMLLGEYGAEIIKVERPGEGDETRRWGPPYYKDPVTGEEMSCYFISLNKNKKSVAVDLKNAEGQEIVKKLAAKSDVLIENFVPGTMKKYGLGYDIVREINPKIVYTSLTGYGQTGPYINRGGYDIIAGSIAGMFSITGTEDQPTRGGVAITDICTALYTHGAIMAALHENKGRWIQADLLATQLSLNTYAASNWLNAGVIGKRWGTAHPSIVPYQSFKCRDGEWITVGAANDALYNELLGALSESGVDMGDLYKYQGNPNRVANRETIISQLDKIFAAEDLGHWLAKFKSCRFPHGAVNKMDAVFEDEQVRHKNVVENCTDSEIKVIKHPITTENGQGERAPTKPPKCGEHTDEILVDLLGFSQERIDALKESEAIE